MLGFLYGTPVCIYDEFREGNVPPAYGQTHANAVFSRIGVLAYTLFIGFKRLSRLESWVRQTIATFRWKMVQVAGWIVRHAGEIVLKLMIDLEKLELFRGIRKKCFELSMCPDG